MVALCARGLAIGTARPMATSRIGRVRPPNGLFRTLGLDILTSDMGVAWPSARELGALQLWAEPAVDCREWPRTWVRPFGTASLPSGRPPPGGFESAAK